MARGLFLPLRSYAGFLDSFGCRGSTVCSYFGTGYLFFVWILGLMTGSWVVLMQDLALCMVISGTWSVAILVFGNDINVDL